MSSHTEDDLRAALRADAALASMPPPPALVDRARALARRRRRRNVAGAVSAVLAVVVAVVVAVSVRPGVHPSSARAGFVPVSYQQACATEPQVCRTGVSGIIPVALTRPVRLSRVGRDVSCPVTRGTSYDGPYVVGYRYGDGPVWLILGDRGHPASGVSVLGTPPQDGWWATENVLLVDKSYQGPFTLRGTRLDGPGRASFGGAPDTTSLFVEPPASGDANNHGGSRTPPATIWVPTPGCYGFQIEGQSFSEIVVIEMVRSGDWHTGS